jgi:chromate transport protein ChrA
MRNLRLIRRVRPQETCACDAAMACAMHDTKIACIGMGGWRYTRIPSITSLAVASRRWLQHRKLTDFLEHCST